MWWPERRAFARRAALASLVALTPPLAACGFHPLYAPPTASTTDPRLAAIQVAQIPERVGQRLTIALRDSFNPSGATVDPKYRLNVTLSTTRRDVAIRRDGTATRAEVAVNANYHLMDLGDGSIAMRGSARSVSSVDLVVNEYANLVAEEDARTRAAEDLALEIQTRCAAFFERPPTQRK